MNRKQLSKILRAQKKSTLVRFSRVLLERLIEIEEVTVSLPETDSPDDFQYDSDTDLDRIYWSACGDPIVEIEATK